MLFEWLRAGHILSVIAWMAGMLILPRYIVHRVENSDEPRFSRVMDEASLRRRRIILTPTMIMSWVFGGGMIYLNWQVYMPQPWFWMKIALVVALTGVHGYFVSLNKRVMAGGNAPSSKLLRMMNEIPFLIAIIAVIMVVIEPF